MIDLSQLSWTLSGWQPFAWRFFSTIETVGISTPEIGPYPAMFPGSVQENLRRAGAIPDWNVALNSLAIEWVEHRHWMFSTEISQLSVNPGKMLWLEAEVLDYAGWVLVDGVQVGEFRGAHTPTRLELSTALSKPGGHRLDIVFDCPPAGQGQFGYTSRARDAKPRYSYGWDWCPRLIPIGARGILRIEENAEVELVSIATEVPNSMRSGLIRVRLDSKTVDRGPDDVVDIRVTRMGRDPVCSSQNLTAGRQDHVLEVNQPDLWWPVGEGDQALYALEVVVRRGGRVVGHWNRQVGFKHIEWRPCEGAPPGALPWLCVVNGRPVFLQGINWTPVRLCYLDVTRQEIERLTGIYRDLGCNILRVWGGGHLESTVFYEACDRLGILIWQEVPLSSSGRDSVPPEDDAFVAECCRIARHFVRSRQHHVSLLQWCGGNELHRDEVVGGAKIRVPLTLQHRVLGALSEVVATEDPMHRFLPTSPFGPRFHSTREEFGKGLHHEVHGPWGVDGFETFGEWERYWLDDDALFRGEIGVAGASRVELLQHYAGSESLWPPTGPLWQHSAAWWIQWKRLRKRFSGMDDQKALQSYVDYSREEQAQFLASAAAAKKGSFPRCGGFIVWMGHDAFPCPINTSIVEFDFQLKPAAFALARVFFRHHHQSEG